MYTQSSEEESCPWLCVCVCVCVSGDLKRLLKKTSEANKTLDEPTIWSYFSQVCVCVCVDVRYYALVHARAHTDTHTRTHTRHTRCMQHAHVRASLSWHMCVQIVDGLRYMHSQRIMHRDIKVR